MSNDLCSPLNCNICSVLQDRKDQQQYKNDSTSSMDKLQKVQALNSCTGCLLVKYCNKNHQKIDWPIHREFCQAIQKIIQSFKLTHPFYISGSVPQSKTDVELAIIEIKFLVTKILKRRLEHQEEELTSFAAHCPVCFKFKSLKSICPYCLNQAYCGEEHRKQHTEEHQRVCGLLQLYYSPFKVIPMEEELICCKLYQRVNDLQKLDLKEMFEVAFHTKLPLNPCTNLQDYQLFAYAADFSCISSICYTLCHLEMFKPKSAKFIIFIVGASIESALWFREIHCKFFFLQYPHINDLDLYFIGPEIVETDDRNLTFEFLASKRSINFHFHKDLFQNYCKNHNVKPSLIVVFNCGFSEFALKYNSSPFVTDLHTLEIINESFLENTWFSGIAKILQTFGTPIMFTSFTQQESDFDFGALQKAVILQKLKVHIDRIFKVSKNPFHDLRPLRQWHTQDKESFYYRNGYIQAICTKLEM